MAEEARTPLVVSFVGAIEQCARGYVEPGDFEGAVYFLDSTRSESVDERGGTHYRLLVRRTLAMTGGDSIPMQQYRDELLSLVLQAETEGRVVWRGAPDAPSTWDGLNELLRRNGLPEVPLFETDFPPRGRYTFSGLRKSIEQHGLPYRFLGYGRT